MLYTYEIGSVRKQEQSFEQAAEQRRQKGREKLRRKETKRGTETKYDTMYTNETQDEEERKSAQLKESNAKMYGKMNGEYDADGATWKSLLPGKFYIWRIFCLYAYILFIHLRIFNGSKIKISLYIIGSSRLEKNFQKFLPKFLAKNKKDSL